MLQNFWNAIKVCFSHKVTTIAGVTSVVCGSGTLLHLIPAGFGGVAMGVCGIAAGLGLIAAPDASKVQPKP